MTADTSQDPLIIIISNRGPFSFSQDDDGKFSIQRGSGGLVTALGALAEEHAVLWVAAALSEGDRAWAAEQETWPQQVEGISLQLVIPDEDEYEKYYNIIANPLLWFIQHELWDIPREPSITEKIWDAWENGYVKMNKLFADTVAETVKDETRPIVILPQDYHLYLTPRYLRDNLGSDVKIQPFVHIPWPGLDAWRILPSQMRNAILDGMLASDIVGFQTKKDAFNFVQNSRFYLDGAHSHGSRDSIEYDGRFTKAIDYPISIDVQKVESIAQETQTQLLKSNILQYTGGRKLILRVDRVEPSKNILRGLEAYRILLENHPEHRGNVQMLSLLVPSRMGVDQYQSYLKDIMAEAGMINAEYSDELWEPVRTILGGNYARAIAAMKIYDVLLVNPIADGMNLVAKEGALVNERNGMIVLSEFAGAYFEMGEHTQSISPFDTYGTAEAMHHALTMPEEQRIKHATALRDMIRENDVRQWFSTQTRDSLAIQRQPAKE